MRELLDWLMLSLGDSIPNVDRFHHRRNVFYKAAGVKIGSNTKIIGSLYFPLDRKGFIEIANDTYINASTRFGSSGSGVKIGDSCLIGPNVSFETGGHDIVYDEDSGRGHTSKEIVVEDKVWIGANSVILQGVRIGAESVIAAGAVVVSDVPSGPVWGDVPAKKINSNDLSTSP